MIRKILHVFLVFVMLLSYYPFSTQVEAANVDTMFTSQLDGTKHFQRLKFPFELETGLSPSTIYDREEFDLGVADEYYNYLIQYITPSVTGTYSITVIEANLAKSYDDTALFLYENSFDPNNPLENLLRGNDDIDFDNEIYLSHIPTIELTAGTNYIIVLTTYEADDTGSVTFKVRGPGTVQYTDQPISNENPPTVVTFSAANITSNSATVGGDVTSDGGAAITERGVVYSTNVNPTIDDEKVTDTANTTGTFTVELTVLDPETTYHYRAFATNANGTSYGDNQTFTTSAAGPTPLEQVTNVQLSNARVATWNTVPNAVNYEVQLYKDENPVGSPFTVTTPSKDVLAEMRARGAGEYTVKVTAKGDGTTYSDGPKSAASSAQTVIQLETVSAGLTWDGNVAKWTQVANAVSYDVQLYNDGTAVGDAVNVSSANAADGVNFSTAISTYGPGTYTYTVTAKGNPTLILDGDESASSTPKILSTITYNGNGSTEGSVPTDSNSYEAGTNVTVQGNTGNLVRTGFTFVGWNTEADGTGEGYGAGDIFTMGTANVTLYAQWTANPTYTVTYNGNGSMGGSVPTDSNNYESGATVTVLGNTGNLENTGYTFIGWNTKADGTGTSYTAGQTFEMGTANVTLYAQWTANPTYTVTYNGNGSAGGSVPTDSNNYEAGTNVTVQGNTGNLVRPGFTFAGWNTKADGTGTSYTAGQTFVMGSSNITLYAKWTAVPSSDGNDSNDDNANAGNNPTPNQPSTEVITVPVETGVVGSGSQVTQTPITRTTDQDGKVKDEVILTPERAKETAEALVQSGQNTARIVIPDEKDAVSQVDISVPKEAIKEIGDHNINLEIFTENVRIIVPQESINNFEDDLYFRVTPIKEELERKEIENRARIEQMVLQIAKEDQVSVISRPMTIETNMQSRSVTLVLPLRDVELPNNAAEREKFLQELVIFIEHSDGDKELVKGTVVEYKDGQLGIEFGINKFSIFTILHMEGFGQNVHKAYMKGYEDGTFKPDRSVTRAEMAAMIARNLGYDDSQKAAFSPFSDVSASHWASGVIEFVKQQGLMVGDERGKFNPNAAITRAEMAVIVARYKNLALPTEAESEKAFPDIADHWAIRNIAANKQAGILNGYEDGTFRPDGKLTRAEAVKVVNRMFDRGPLYGITTPSFNDVPFTHWAFYEVEEATQEHFFTMRDHGGEDIVKE